MTNHDVTHLLQAMETGNREGVSEQIIALVYDELRSMAQGQMGRERPAHTLQPTALVNEAYIRLVKGEARWQSRAHFFGAAAKAMQRILIDHARRYQAEKRGGRDAARVTLHDLEIEGDDLHLDLIALDKALTDLDAFDNRLANVVRLRYFAGMGLDETAALLNVSRATIKRDWTYARAWLLERMGEN